MTAGSLHARCIFPPEAPDGYTPPDVLDLLGKLASTYEVAFHFSERRCPPLVILEGLPFTYEKETTLSDGTILLEGCRAVECGGYEYESD